MAGAAATPAAVRPAAVVLTTSTGAQPSAGGKGVTSSPATAAHAPKTWAERDHGPVRPTPTGCQADPAATIESLSPGAVFHGSGCYDTSGIDITRPVTIDGGTYYDGTSSRPPDGPVLPIIRIKDTTDVTIENVALQGANTDGGFHRHLVGAAGLDILSSSHVTITHVATIDTFGDGMTVFANFPTSKLPTTDLLVDGLDITQAGREGITMAYAEDSTLDGVTVHSAAWDGWDFESDLPGVGSGDITVNDASGTKGIRFIEALQGPITFNNCKCQRHLTLTDAAAASGQPVTFNGGTLLLPNTDHGDVSAGVMVKGPGDLLLTGVTLGRLPATRAPSGATWSVTDGGHLTLDRTSSTGPPGIHDGISTVVSYSS